MKNDKMLESNQIAMFQALQKEIEQMRQKNNEEVVHSRKNEEEIQVLKEQNEEMRQRLADPIPGGHGQRRQPSPQRSEHTQNQNQERRVIAQTQTYQSSRR